MRVLMLAGSVVVLVLGLLLVGHRAEIGWPLTLMGVVCVATWLWSLAMRKTLPLDWITSERVGPGR